MTIRLEAGGKKFSLAYSVKPIVENQRRKSTKSHYVPTGQLRKESEVRSDQPGRNWLASSGLPQTFCLTESDEIGYWIAMQKFPLNPALIGCSALLIAMLWFFSQKSWSHYEQTLGTRDQGTVTWTTSQGDQKIGADYYFGGSSVLLLASAWLVGNLFVRKDKESFQGLISLGVSILGMIALARWLADCRSHAPSVSMRYLSAGQYLDDAGRVAIGLVAALALLGTITIILGRRNEAREKDGQ